MAQISTVNSPVPPGTNINVFVYNESNVGPLVSVTDGTNNIPFTVLYDAPGVREIDEFHITVPADVLTNSVTLNWTNYSTNVPVVTQPIFDTQPQNESVFVGTTVILPAQAVHTSGYQWQLNGMNLVEGSHFIGVTNSTLTISNVQMSDAGDYTVIAGHPLNPATASATLSVYMPIVLGLSAPSASSITLTIANQDDSPFEAARVSNLQIFSSTDLTSAFSTWNQETNTGSIINGVLEINVPYDGNAAQYWRVLEQ